MLYFFLCSNDVMFAFMSTILHIIYFFIFSMMDNEKICPICHYKSSELNSFIDHFRLTHPFEPIRIIFPNANNQSYSLMNYNVSSAYIGSHSVTFCDDLVLREVDNHCKIPDIKRSKLVPTLMKQNVYSQESGTASIDTCNGKDDINKEQI